MNRSGSFRVWLTVWMVVNAIAFLALIGIGAVSLKSSPKDATGACVLIAVGLSGLITTGLIQAGAAMAATAADDLGRLVQLQTDLNGALKRARA